MSMKPIVILSVLLAGATLSGAARAEYLCSVTHDPRRSSFNSVTGQTTYYGSYGTIYVTSYSEPACSGTYRGSFTLCSVGATYSSCSNSANLLSVSQFYPLLAMFRAAASEQQNVFWSTTTTDGPYFRYYGY
jgi:hypothetical protein